jgi:hypothetical protein
MAGARWSKGLSVGRGHSVLFIAAILLLLPLAVSLFAVTARAGQVGAGDESVLSALAGVQPLPVGEMAKESARGLGGETEAGVHIPVTVPTVRLWDDFGAFSPSSIGNTVVTISTGGAGQ